MRRFTLALSGVLVLGLTACSEDEVEVSPTYTILEHANENVNLDVLTAAILRAGGDIQAAASGRNNNLTVFAPNDAAFVAYLGVADEAAAIAAVNALDPAALTALLQYHILGELRYSSTLTATQRLTSLATNGLPIYTRAATTSVNFFRANGARIMTPDIYTGGGVVHVINQVLVPPTGTVASVVAGSSDFDLLEAALTRANLVTTLQGAGPFTVFAPTDAAFITYLGVADEAAALAEITTNITAGDFTTNVVPVLQLHVLGNNTLIFANDVTATAATVPTLSGTRTLSAAVVSTQVRLTDPTASFSTVVAPFNITATNGVVHSINRVLRFPMP